MAIKLNAEIRKVAGKGAARAVRKSANIPAVIYGEKNLRQLAPCLTSSHWAFVP